ncbi:ribonuclease H-like protein [Conidiobolus coronatus NRRL 28638]|uniref:Ribonuclease H-like protein n=1 Tax=Conidiobolus coronatus (strain ATCC 28846 / CBS 209.66 / NRRL 28638) TaxID=796925 RepID=A0A137NWI0_CONC2|nr:ribonuclease H-like protein [Conidiobolus coronatus NRRL 28638]|eukprot:KXN66974.1 ribonuclease H-like protein [Conidiobolus coronatus NRRL 28638]
MSKLEYPLVWIDCEMTGLDLKVDTILEICILLTDKDLNVVSETLELVINHSDSVLENMNDWCKVHHKESGLVDKVKNSTISLKAAEAQILNFLKPFVKQGERLVIAGNSVHVDKQFIEKDFPLVNELLHYRVVDVSTIKELCKRWSTQVFNDVPMKKLNHRAKDDILESIDELNKFIFSFD